MEPRRGLFGLSRSVWLLGWVSLATDAASEAIYPLLPFFLTQVLGAGAVSLGLIEGLAEAVNSGLKIAAGRLADRSQSKRPLMLVGYALSSAVKPLIGLAQSWVAVLGVRVLDRVGKGVRGAPRDAMLAGLATPTTRGKVFGFHRAMDHTGAVIGPVLASLFLMLRPGEYRTLFALTAIPGAISVGLILLIREERPAPPGPPALPAPPGRPSQPRRSSLTDQEASEGGLDQKLIAFFVVLGIFTLGNSTDAFLLLRLTEVGGSVQFVPLMWAALHVVKATSSIVAGSWSDKVGRRVVIAGGWLVYALVYAGFAASTRLSSLLIWFLVYGLYFGLTEGVEKALVADLAPTSRRGYAFGIYTAVQGVGALAASLLFGIIWSTFGAPAAFGTGAALALISAALLGFVL